MKKCGKKDAIKQYGLPAGGLAAGLAFAKMRNYPTSWYWRAGAVGLAVGVVGARMMTKKWVCAL
jgi:hypothetical protein